MGNLSNLEILYLDANQLSGTIPAALGDLTSLERLYLAFNQLSDTIPAALGDMTSLEGLYLHTNPLLSGAIPMSLGSLANLTSLWLYDTTWTGAYPDGIPQALRAKQTAGTLELLTNRRPVPPTMADPAFTVGVAFSYPVAFTDPDGDTLTYHATRADGSALPAWLTIG